MHVPPNQPHHQIYHHDQTNEKSWTVLKYIIIRWWITKISNVQLHCAKPLMQTMWLLVKKKHGLFTWSYICPYTIKGALSVLTQQSSLSSIDYKVIGRHSPVTGNIFINEDGSSPINYNITSEILKSKLIKDINAPEI